MSYSVEELKERFKPTAHRRKRIFDKPPVAIAFGIVLPVACLFADPIIFRGDNSLGPLLGAARVACYGYMLLGMISLVTWLTMRWCPSFFLGLLIGGSVFALLLGLFLLPFSFFGLFLGIGLLGFSPFLTATTFLSCAMSAKATAGDRLRPMVSILAFTMFATLPIGIQSYVTFKTDQAISMIVDGSGQLADRGINQFRMLGVLLDPNSLIWRYEESNSESAGKRIVDAYSLLIGNDFEERRFALFD